MLEVQGITVNYGPVRAVTEVSFSVAAGEVLSLVGSNGAGKSTIIKAIMGMQAPSSGSIVFDGQQLAGCSPADIVARGIALSPEGRRVFPRMSVHENLLCGAHLASRAIAQQRLEPVYARFPRLRERRRQAAGSMSGGEQQMLAIGRALMAAPSLLLLDEPTLGLSPVMVKEIARVVEDIRKDGMSVLLVEQNAMMALRVCDRALVIENGRTTLSGNGRALLTDNHVRSAYLGL